MITENAMTSCSAASFCRVFLLLILAQLMWVAHAAADVSQQQNLSPSQLAGVPEAHASSEAQPAEHQPAHGHEGPDLGTLLPLWSCLPFAGMLLSIALWPLGPSTVRR